MASILNATTSSGLVTSADNSGSLQLATNNGTTAVTIDTNQRAAFVAGTAALPAITTTGDTNTGIFFPAADTIAFSEGGAEAARFDASGRLLIGTTSGTRKLTVYENAAQVDISIVSSTTGVAILQMGDTAADNQGQIIYRNNGDSMEFGVNGAERMRITSGGDLLVGSTSISGARVNISNTAAGGRTLYLNKGTGDTTDYFIVADTTTQNRFLVAGTGDVQNTNNSYGAISDVKLKENIVDATSKLEDLCKVKVRNYNLIGDTQKQIGVVAQELEQVFAGLVQETKDTDKEGNDLGTTTKAVKYSVFVPMLIKAVQELKAELDATKAEVQALKGVA